MSKNRKPHVCYFEIPADNPERSKKFYSELFGWKIEKDTKKIPTPTLPEYFTISPKEEERPQPDNSRPSLGGLLKRQNYHQTITIFIDVPSVDTFSNQVKKLGGQIVSPKTPVPGAGYFAICKDTENNAFALWEENKAAR